MASNFQKQMSDLKSTPTRLDTYKVWLRLDRRYFLARNAQIWALGLQIWKKKASSKFQTSPILKFWVISGCFTTSRGLLWLVSLGLNQFRQVLVDFWSIWLALGFSSTTFYFKPMLMLLLTYNLAQWNLN